MPLGFLDLRNCPVSDLSPLAGVNLNNIFLPPRVNKGTSILHRMKNLSYINNVQAKTWWKNHDAGQFKQYQP